MLGTALQPCFNDQFVSTCGYLSFLPPTLFGAFKKRDEESELLPFFHLTLLPSVLTTGPLGLDTLDHRKACNQSVVGRQWFFCGKIYVFRVKSAFN